MDLLPHKEGLATSTQDGPITEIVRILESKRDKAVSDRSDVESRWLRDLQQFEGNTLDRMTKGDADYRSAVRKSPPVVHLTRTRTLAIAARIINMLVPSNERSWSIEPTPVPELLQRANDDSPVLDQNTGQIAMVPDLEPNPDALQHTSPPMMQQPGMQPEGVEQPMRPVTEADLANLELEEAEEKAQRMEKHMDDQLTEGRFNAEQRKIIVDGCRIGTGVLEGPVVGGNYRKKRTELPGGQWVTQHREESAPQYKCIDPWNFYPMPAENITSCEGVFIDQLMTRREVQELRLLPGFDNDMISEVLREKPHHSDKYAASLVQRANVSGETLSTDNRYSIWKYTGSLTADELEELGVEIDEELDMVDPIVEAWFVNGRLLKIKRHALEGSYRLPYCVWNYEESETTMFGYGVPYLMRDSDRVIQSTWHMILHNAAISAGPQIVRDATAIEPADGSEEITGGLKQWRFTDPEKSIKDAFSVFHIDARIDELSAVHERARENADEELAFPLLAQGEPTEAVPTSSGMAMLLNATNVVQRRIAQSYDDDVLEPSISALYDYNMIYLPDNDAKGDMTIKPMGATKLVVKDMQAQHMLLIADITTNDRFAPLMKDDKLLRGILKAAEVDPEEYMKSEEDMQNQGPSEQEMAELESLQAETELTRAKAQDLMSGAGDQGGMSPSEMAELQYKYDRMEVDLNVAQIKLEEASLEAARSESVALADIEAKFNLGERADETKRMIASMQERRKEITEGYMAGLKSEELAQKRKNLEMGFDTHG